MVGSWAGVCCWMILTSDQELGQRIQFLHLPALYSRNSLPAEMPYTETAMREALQLGLAGV